MDGIGYSEGFCGDGVVCCGALGLYKLFGKAMGSAEDRCESVIRSMRIGGIEKMDSVNGDCPVLMRSGGPLAEGV